MGADGEGRAGPALVGAVLLAVLVGGSAALLSPADDVDGPASPALERRNRSDGDGGATLGSSGAGTTGAETSVHGDPLLAGLLSVTDGAAFRDGWIVLDRRGRRVHRLGRDGSAAGTFGRRGAGPGEYRDPVAVAAVADTVFVVERVGATLHLYDPAGPFLGRRTPEIPGCFVPLVLDAGGTEAGPVLLVRCVDPSSGGAGDGTTEIVALIPSAGAPRVLSRSPAGGARGRKRSLFAEPLLATGPRIVVLGRQNRRCLRLYRVGTGEAAPAENRCLPNASRTPLEAEDRKLFRQYVEGLEARSGIRFESPRNHPVVYRIFVAGEDPVGLVPAARGSLSLVRLSSTDSAGRRPAWGDGPFLVTATHVLEYREELHGIRIRIRPHAPS